MYCALCQRPVEARRHVGIGSAILAFVTLGMSVLAIPFYPKRCSICRSAAVTNRPPSDALVPGSNALQRLEDMEQRLRLTEGELESVSTELDRLRSERDFYRQLLDDPTRRADPPRG